MTTPPAPTAALPSGSGAGWADLVAGFTPVLAQAAGADAHLVSLSLDLAGADAGPAGLPSFTARLDRGGRTVAFVSGEARTADGALIAAVTAVFRRG